MSDPTSTAAAPWRCYVCDLGTGIKVDGVPLCKECRGGRPADRPADGARGGWALQLRDAMEEWAVRAGMTVDHLDERMTEYLSKYFVTHVSATKEPTRDGGGVELTIRLEPSRPSVHVLDAARYGIGGVPVPYPKPEAQGV